MMIGKVEVDDGWAVGCIEVEIIHFLFLSF